MLRLAKMSPKRLARWVAWRTFRFKFATHLVSTLVEWLTARLVKEQMAFQEMLSALNALAKSRQPPPPPPDLDGWKANKQMMELMTIALGPKE
jgi:hypothetical protein